MKNYTVYFEIYGKKLKVKIKAQSESVAKEMVRQKIIFHKVEDNTFDFKDIFDTFFKK